MRSKVRDFEDTLPCWPYHCCTLSIDQASNDCRFSFVCPIRENFERSRASFQLWSSLMGGVESMEMLVLQSGTVSALTIVFDQKKKDCQVERFYIQLKVGVLSCHWHSRCIFEVISWIGGWLSNG